VLPDLDGALRLGAVDAELADGGVDAAFLSVPAPICSLAFNRRNLRRLIFPLR
jgi:hypothetical protein